MFLDHCERPLCFSLSKTGSKYTPLIFVCDEEAGAIFESSADFLDFRPLPIPNVHRPVAVAYSPKEDLIFWIDAEYGTLNRAFRNGSGHTVLLGTYGGKDLTRLMIISNECNYSGTYISESG